MASDSSIQAALEPVKFFQSICKRGCHVSSRLAVQTLGLDETGTGGRIPEGAPKIPSGLAVVV